MRKSAGGPFSIQGLRGSLHPAAPRGVTLIELLTVVGLLAMLLALSAFTYIRMSRSFKEQGAASELDVVLRQSRNSALTGNAYAFVQIDTEKRKIVPWVYKTVGFWHFEDKNGYGKTRGAYHDGVFRGGELYPEGKIGKCVRLRDAANVDVGNDPDFDLEDGGYLEAYIRPMTYQFNGDNFVFSKAGAYALWIRHGGVLCGQIGPKKAEAPQYKIVPNRWTKVALAWDALSMRLYIDDGLVAVGPGAKAPITDTPLLIGHDSASLIGLIDEARVMSATGGNPIQLPPQITITHTAAPWNGIYFAPDGNLDMRFHPGPVSVSLTSGNKIRTVYVSMMGQTQRMEVENTVKSDETADVQPTKPLTTAQKAKLKVYEDGKEAKQGAPSAPSGGAK